MKKIITCILMFMACICAMAEEKGHAIEICTDKIVIKTDSLNLPKSTTVQEVLTLLPDLLERVKDFVLENYTIQINGKSVGDARDAVLQQIRLSDLKCIEVSENSLSAVSALGQGGGISLELKSPTEGISGAVNADVSIEANYAGGLRLDDKKGKWSFQSVATVENYVPSLFKKIYSEGFTESSKKRDFSEYVAAFINYEATKSDLLKFTVSEVYTNSRSWENTEGVESDKQYQRIKNTNLFAAINYDHTFSAMSKLCMEVNYRYIPEKFNQYLNKPTEELVQKKEYSYNHMPHNVYSDLKLEQSLFKPTATTSAKMELGVQYSYSTANNNSNINSKSVAENTYNTLINTIGGENAYKTFDVVEKTYFLRPYLKIESKLNKWTFMGTVDYQHFSYDTKLKDTEYDYDHHCRQNVTGQVVAMYTPNSKNLLRLRFERKIDRPEAIKMFPYPFIDITSDVEIVGNAELKPAKQNAIDLDYCVNLSTEDYHLELKASTEYSRTFDLINTTLADNKITYINDGRVNILTADLGLYFRKGCFSTWIAGNLYHNHEKQLNHKEHHTYYNFLLRPVLNLRHGWNISTSITYNSPITSYLQESGKMFYGTLRIGKTWDKFSAYIYGLQNFIGKTRTNNYSKEGVVTSYSDKEYIHSYIGAGVRYAF